MTASKLNGILGTAAAMWIATVAFGPAHAEKVYKLTDEGLTTYQDRAPNSDQDHGHEVLNNQGVVMQEIKSREDRRIARRLERERELSKIRDRALLATFTTESDLIRTRDDRVGMIDGLISRLDDRIRILSDRLDVIDKRVMMQEKTRGEGEAQDSLYEEQLSIQRNIENAWSLIDAKAVERAEVSEKFDNDLIRYRELKTYKPQ